MGPISNQPDERAVVERARPRADRWQRVLGAYAQRPEHEAGDQAGAIEALSAHDVDSRRRHLGMVPSVHLAALHSKMRLCPTLHVEARGRLLGVLPFGA